MLGIKTQQMLTSVSTHQWKFLMVWVSGTGNDRVKGWVTFVSQQEERVLKGWVKKTL